MRAHRVRFTPPPAPRRHPTPARALRASASRSTRTRRPHRPRRVRRVPGAPGVGPSPMPRRGAVASSLTRARACVRHSRVSPAVVAAPGAPRAGARRYRAPRRRPARRRAAPSAPAPPAPALPSLCYHVARVVSRAPCCLPHAVVRAQKRRVRAKTRALGVRARARRVCASAASAFVWARRAGGRVFRHSALVGAGRVSPPAWCAAFPAPRAAAARARAPGRAGRRIRRCGRGRARRARGANPQCSPLTLTARRINSLPTTTTTPPSPSRQPLHAQQRHTAL